ncbi:MAG: hypothetical protein HN403_12420 [Rhodospirillales bacterium]|jgi:hypothetical protein|nr:hypothetical protein [Rhodospirillales bacterium]
MPDKSKSKSVKEIREILKDINPALKRLLEITDDPGEMETVLFESIRSGARSLRIARRIAKKD